MSQRTAQGDGCLVAGLAAEGSGLEMVSSFDGQGMASAVLLPRSSWQTLLPSFTRLPAFCACRWTLNIFQVNKVWLLFLQIKKKNLVSCISLRLARAELN